MSADPPVDAGVAEAAAEPRPPARRACVVMLGGHPFAVDVTEAREVIVLDVTTPVPGAPSALVGVMNLRGSVLPVVEARPLLGLPVRGGLRALVVADGDRRAAVMIEAVIGLAGFDDVAPLAGHEGVPAALVRGRVTTESGETVTLLDGPALLAAARRAWNPGATSRTGHHGA